jgi:NAD(P)-dependent dehydrogenase (short-subunit alcohol dehydrogenase family)
MTQEELDALMAGGLDDSDLGDENADDTKTEDTPVTQTKDEEIEENVAVETESEDKEEEFKGANEYRADPNIAWPPPPPTDDHKMVSQLDDVTRDSEVKAGEIFDKLESVNNVLMDAESDVAKITPTIEENIALFEKLVGKFPNIEQFSKALAQNKEAKEKLDALVSNAQMGEDEIMMAMDIMQYQDIHRQKIERVINVMRALSKYISLLFEGAIDDKNRVGSAVHIEGDEDTDDLVTSEDIEAIIESLGKKK